MFIKEFFEDGDIAGDKLFWFQTPKHKDAMAVKASESANKVSDQRRPVVRRRPTTNMQEVDVDTANRKTQIKKTPSKQQDAAAKDNDKNKQQFIIRSKTPYSLRTCLKRRK